MLTIIEKPPTVRRFIVWDLEWVPRTYELRICGVFDSRTGYRHYKTIRQFLREELCPYNSGLWFYAHFGGQADLQFIIEEILSVDAGFSVRGVMKDSSIVKCTIRRGSLRWNFLDSGWMLRRPLREIAKWMGMEKTGPTDNMTDEQVEEWYRSVDERTLIDYNRNDCLVLWHAMFQTQQTILELGGQMQATLPASGMQLFRRKYLHEEIPTNGSINEIAKGTYYASRVEVFQKDVNYPGLYYDINSSFPFAMTQPMPGRLFRNYLGRIPDDVWDHYPFLALCDVSVPDFYLPPLAVRMKGRVFFPTGKWRGWFSGIDLKLLLAEGGTFQKVFRCIAFEPFYDLKAYVDDLYLLRNRSKGFEKEFYKLMLNSLYGKFAEAPDKTVLLINPTAGELARLNRDTDMLFPGCFLKPTYTDVPHAHVPISSYITALARRTLFDFLSQADEIHYCDTDGFSTTEEDYHLSAELGGLKLEKTFRQATFLVPKFYTWFPTDGSKQVVKAKGFSLSKEHAGEEFDKLIEGGEVRIERMARLRENLRRRIIKPHDLVMQKRLRQLDFLKSLKLDSIPKRFMYPDGRTRPWNISELLNPK